MELNELSNQSFHGVHQEGRSINIQNLNVNLQTLHVARTQFYHLILS